MAVITTIEEEIRTKPTSSSATGDRKSSVEKAEKALKKAQTTFKQMQKCREAITKKSEEAQKAFREVENACNDAAQAAENVRAARDDQNVIRDARSTVKNSSTKAMGCKSKASRALDFCSKQKADYDKHFQSLAVDIKVVEKESEFFIREEEEIKQGQGNPPKRPRVVTPAEGENNP
jgi:uncharacterized phage infection (PIP) family protein YhgE